MKKSSETITFVKASKYAALLFFFFFQFSSSFGQEAPDIIWDKTYGGSKNDSLTSIQQTTDGGYVVAGITWSNDGDVSDGYDRGLTDFWVVKLDGSGNKVWDKTYGGSDYDYVESIQQTSDGGYIVAGYTYSNDGDVSDGNNGGSDYWIVKLDGSGNKVWDKTYGGSSYDYAESIQQTSDGGYIVAGYTSSNDGDISDGNNGGYDYWVVKLDGLGNKVWDKTYGGSYGDYAESIQQTSDGGYILAGYTSSNDGDVSDGNDGGLDYWIIKLEADPSVSVNSLQTKNNFSMYPNPACSQIAIQAEANQLLKEVVISDMTGKIVKQFEIQNTTTEIDVSNLQNGIYMVKSGNFTQKLIKK